TGLIVLRTLLAALTFGLIACIDVPALWAVLPIVLFAAQTAISGLMDRPLLFTYVLLATFLLILTRVLDATQPGPESTRLVRRATGLLVILELLWVNLHGAAALIGVGVAGAALMQIAWDRWLQKPPSDEKRVRRPDEKTRAVRREKHSSSERLGDEHKLQT